MENKEKVTKYEFRKSITAFCPLGDRGYLASITAEVYPDDVIADFIDIDKAILDLEGKPLTGEAMAGEVYKILKDTYKTDKIRVAVDGYTNAHLSVIIHKDGF